MKIWGIDPGKQGHLVSYDKDSRLFQCHKIEWELENILAQLDFYVEKDDEIWVEKIRIHGRGTGHIEKLVRHHERIINALEFKGYEFGEVTPIGWQDRLQLRALKGETETQRKTRYHTFAKHRAQTSNITKIQGEAYCICIYGIAIWLQNLREQQSTKG